MIRRGELWTPTRDANAVASEVDLSKIVYVDGAKVTGTRLTEYAITPTTLTISIPSVSVGTATAAI